MTNSILLYDGYDFIKKDKKYFKGVNFKNIDFVERAGNILIVHYKDGVKSQYIKNEDVYEFKRNLL